MSLGHIFFIHFFIFYPPQEINYYRCLMCAERLRNLIYFYDIRTVGFVVVISYFCRHATGIYTYFDKKPIGYFDTKKKSQKHVIFIRKMTKRKEMGWKQFWGISMNEFTMICFWKFHCEFRCFKKTCQIFNFHYFSIILVPVITITTQVKMPCEFLVSDKHNSRNRINHERAFFSRWVAKQRYRF